MKKRDGSPPSASSSPEPAREAHVAPFPNVRRFGRLVRKELREILRDRRTVLTLFLMPFLLYPILTVIFQQFLLSNLVEKHDLPYRIGFSTEKEKIWFRDYLQQGIERELKANLVFDGRTLRPLDKNEYVTVIDLGDAVRKGVIDVGIRLDNFQEAIKNPDMLEMNCSFIYQEETMLSSQAMKQLEDYLQIANNAYMDGHVKRLGSKQRMRPVRGYYLPLDKGGDETIFTLSVLIPLILSLMTAAGAVYPAIDLTAGERERGTLEMLVATPVPRKNLLFAKYAAVLCVALLTAFANLGMMILTMRISGMEQLLLQSSGLTALHFFQILGLLILFAVFFSAMLLLLSSFARSFKEAQAYLIPLMLLALAPGISTLLPLEVFSTWTSIVPVMNIVLLSRSILLGDIVLGNAILTIFSTLLYALAAISAAAKFFGSEGVLYMQPGGWRDLFRRSRREHPAPSLSAAFLCLALILPCQFMAANLISGSSTPSSVRNLEPSIQQVEWQITLMGAATFAIFFVLPFIAAYFARVPWSSGFQFRRPHSMSAWGAALLLGVSLWPFAHEIVLLQEKIGIAPLDLGKLESVRELAEKLPEVSLFLTLVAVALAPAVAEEWLFRGFIFGALKAKYGPWVTILSSATLFGLFHLIGTSSLNVERFLPTTFLGIALGWVAWHSRSILPGMVLHFAHNGLLMVMAHYQEQLKELGWGTAETAHVPTVWLVVAGGMCCAGIVLLISGGTPKESSNA